MADQLSDLRNDLLAASDQLLDERNIASAANEPAKVAVAEAEFDRIAVVLSTVQFAINNQQALNMNAVAARLQESVEAQRAIGLSTAATTLATLVSRIRSSLPTAPAQPTQPDPRQPLPPGGIRAKPGGDQAVIDKLIAVATEQNLDPMTVLTIVSIESEFDPTAVSPLSSAGGLFQFLDETWLGEGGGKFGRGGMGHGFAAGAPVDDQIEIGCRFIAKIANDLALQLGPSPSATTIYMAHQQGLAGALTILRSDPSAPIETVIKPEAARNNGFGGLTVAQTIAKFNTLVRSHGDEVAGLVTATAPSSREALVGPPSGGPIAPKTVHIALTEMEMFARQDGRVITETQEPLRQRVLQYFSVVGRPDIKDPSTEPWSAAFISFVMLTAGVSSTQFPFSQSHHKYILAALANRMNNNLSSSIVYFDKNEMVPRVGDLIGFSRTAEVKNRADIERCLPDKFFPSHTDLVIDVSDGKIKVIGGNVSQTILTQTVRTGPSGNIDPSDEHFFVLRTNF